MDREFIDFTKIFNFRGLGGLRTTSGETLKEGKLYRSDNLGALTSNDFTKFSDLGICTIVDLRPPDEISQWGGAAPAWSAKNWVNVALKNPAWPVEDYSYTEGPVAYLVRRYLELLELSGKEIVTVIGLISKSTVAPVVIHCLGGRDRTGVVVALILALLGIPDSEIFADYHLTELAHARLAAWQSKHEPDAIPAPPYVAQTPEEVMSQVFDTLRNRYGSIENYLKLNGLTDSEIISLRESYLAS